MTTATVKDTDVIIVGAGVGGLVLALSLHQAGIACRVYEAIGEIKPLGVGINLLPHAARELDELGLLPVLDTLGVHTKESIFFTRHGQFIYSEPAGKAAGYAWPQYSIHRGDLQMALLAATRERLGADSVVTDHRAVRVEQEGDVVTVHMTDSEGKARPPVRGAIVVGCDGIHSALRKQLYPDEGAPRYSGVNMWRGTTRCKPFLSGGSMVRAGWLSTGKMVIYPIQNNIDAEGNQLVNWVAEIESDQPAQRDWNRQGRLDDFFPAFADWHFDWLDVAGLIQNADSVLEYPMVDQDPLPTWTKGRMTLLGDAAHPMVPRGSNGAGQAIIDARYLAGQLKRQGLTEAALQDYDRVRVDVTTRVVLTNRTNPPDAILREAFVRSNDKPFERIEDVISRDELEAISTRYKQVAGFDPETLTKRPSFL
jgi:2-polyprenyl-6-methoxyphenol hydroxylase-like FAD-dependent oxidoreductase